MRPPSEAIGLAGVTRRFPGVLALDRIDLSLRPGEVHALLGENGAGKSTAVEILAGLQQPDAGTVRIGGAAVTLRRPAAALARGVGVVFQHSMLAPSLSVADNLLLGGAWWLPARRESLRERFAAACALLGASIPLSVPVGHLSLGQRQQVEVIRALWRGGTVLVLDEPTATLTPDAAAGLGGSLRRLAAQGLAVLFVTHRLSEALDWSDRLTVLRAGRVAGRADADTWRAGRSGVEQAIIGMMFGAGADRTAPPRRPGSDRPVLSVEGLGGVLSLQVAAGEILAMAGVDGNGQAALVQTLAGQRAGPGRVVLRGRELTRLGVATRRRAGLRVVSDDRLGEGVIGRFSVALNLLLKQVGEPPFWRHGVIVPDAVRRHAETLIEAFDIRTPSADAPVAGLSGGNVQKVVLAREQSPGTVAIIYHKPTAGLDLRNALSIRARIAAAAADGVAILLVSADLDEILDLAHRVAVMVQGRIVGIVQNGDGARAAVGRLMARGGVAP